MVFAYHWLAERDSWGSSGSRQILPTSAVRSDQYNAERRGEPSMLDVSTFAYDAEAAFDFSVHSERMRDGARVQDVSFKSPLSGRVSAYLITPSAPQPRAGLIFGHW